MIIATVPYLNALPLTRFLSETLIRLVPSQLVEQVLCGRADVGLIPIQAALKHKLHLYPDSGLIGCNGTVKSVGLFTRSYIGNLSDIKSIYFDTESQTSVGLAKILLHHHGVKLNEIESVHFDNSEKADAQMLIGDKALFFNKDLYRFWDLGALWKELTGEGFVFACYASKRKLSHEELGILENAKTLGLKSLTQIAEDFSKDQREDVFSYLTNNITYHYTTPLKNGFKLYKKYVKDLNLI
jgi:chorismate dehydratase